MIPRKESITRRFDVRDFYGHKELYASSDSTRTYTMVDRDSADIDKHLAMPTSVINDVLLPGGETRIPFTLQNYWILIEVRINGKGPYQMMLDSGGSDVLSASAAYQAGVTDVGSVPQSGNSPLIKPLRFVRAESVEVGGATLGQQYFHIGSIGNVFTRDGMIGAEVFECFVTTIDYANRQIILRLPDGKADPTKESASEGLLPLEFDDTKPVTPCGIAGAETTCIIDTGAAVALILSGPFAKANSGIQPPWYAGSYNRIYGSSGASEVRYGPLSTFQIGPFALANVDTFFTTAANGALAEYLSALVGNRILQRFTVTLDYAHETLQLTPNASFAQR